MNKQQATAEKNFITLTAEQRRELTLIIKKALQKLAPTAVELQALWRDSELTVKLTGVNSKQCRELKATAAVITVMGADFVIGNYSENRVLIQSETTSSNLVPLLTIIVDK